MADVARHHTYLRNSQKLDETEKTTFQKIVDEKLDIFDVADKFLSLINWVGFVVARVEAELINNQQIELFEWGLEFGKLVSRSSLSQCL